MKINVGIVGVTGYSGQELLKILLRHPQVSVRYLAARRLTKPTPAGKMLPVFQGLTELKIYPFRLLEARAACDLLFLALPSGVAMKIVPALLKKPTLRVIDLSGDFRLRSSAAFLKAYHLRHKASQLLGKALYGLSEIMKDKLYGARLVANPGCYPTAALLGLAPLAENRLLSSKGLVIDAKSGVTGAGRSLQPEANEDLMAYRVDGHQHTPEMVQTLKALSGRSIQVTFVPHLIPMNRGLYATIYAPLSKRIGSKTLRSIYQKRYSKEPFVRLLPQGSWPKTGSVQGTNFCDIALLTDSKNQRAIILTAIDNLVKGAAGQAVQNMNLVYGLPETEGLK